MSPERIASVLREFRFDGFFETSAKRGDGVQELRHLIQRYPKTTEATQARERLKKLGVSSSSRTGE